MQSVVYHTRVALAASMRAVRRTSAWFTRRAPQIGQSMVEYAIIAAIVAVVALTAVRLLGTSVTNAFNRTETAVNSAGTP